MKADSVKLEGVTLTNESNLVVTCEGSWNQKRTAVYNNTDWICFNLSAPDTEGTKQIVIKAAMGGADPDSKSFDLFVVNDTSQYLDVDAKEFSTWQSPVSLSFAINYTDPDEGSTAVTQLYEQSLEIFYEDSGGLIVNTTLTGGSNGIYESRFEVPFAGGYTYTLNVKTVIDDVLYESLDVNGFFDVLQGSGATIALDVDPELTKPNGMVNVSIEFTLAGEPLKDQELEVVITGRGEVETYNINDENWNDETEKYERTIDLSDFTSECIYIINVSSDADRSLNDDSILYVADPDAVGTNKEDCPVNPSRCDNLQDVRNCYQFLEDNPQAGPDEIGFVKQCAVKGLPYCEGGSSGSTTCIQGLKLKVEQGSATTPDLFFRIPGSTDGSTSTGLSYTMPSGSGDYYMTLVHMPGGEIEGGPEDGIDAINNVQSLSNIALLPLTISSGGDLNVTAFCPVNCGGVGDLDNYDGAFKDGDIAAMATVIDTLQLIGETPYDEDELSCVDINGDGYITLEDYECISTNGISCSDCEVDSDLEICNDYVDNNCDGQIDSETYDNDAESLYSLSSGVIEDLCSCTSKTPCEMLYSVSNGNYEITNEDDTKRCVSLNGEAYSWKTQSQWQCDLSKANNYLECDGTPYVCQEVSDSYVWLKGGGAGTYPLGDLDLSKCYNEVCDSDETCSNCPNDCGACCGNGACGSGETCNSCFQDCSQIQSVWSTSCGSNCNYVHVQASNLPGNIGDTFGHTYASLSQFSFSKISDDEVKMTSGVWNTGREILISGLNSGSIKLTYSGSTICI